MTTPVGQNAVNSPAALFKARGGRFATTGCRRYVFLDMPVMGLKPALKTIVENRKKQQT